MGARALCLGLGVGVVDVSLRKVGWIGELTSRTVLGAALAASLVAFVVAWAWPLPRYCGARSLDRFYGLHDRLATALDFAARPDSERTAFMRVAIEDASDAARELNPRLAVPILLPPALVASAGLGLILGGLTLFEVRRHVPLAHAEALAPIDVSGDDIDDVKDFIAQLSSRGSSDEIKDAITELNRIVTDIADKRLDGTEVFRRLEALDLKLTGDSSLNRERLERSLRAVGEILKTADLSRSIGSALQRDDLSKAADALRELANRIRNPANPVDKAKLDELREALKKAARLPAEGRSALQRRRRQLAEEVDRLKDRLADGGADEERSLLEKDRQELERLDRNLEAQRADEGRLDRLDRELEKAAEDLAKDLGASANDLEQGAEDIHHLEKEQMSQQEKEALRQRIEELRELLRQQGGAAGKVQIARLKRFSRTAHGRGQGDGPGSGGGQEPEGAGAQGQQGGTQGEQSGETWVLGPNGEKVLLLADGRKEQGGGAGQNRPQRGAGEGHDPHVQGAPTSSKMSTEDTQVQGAETGQGGSRSEAILGAAQRGFAAQNYRKVFMEYHQVAEESLARDEIPGGYRFYVKRYFQLIRPRDDR